MDKLLFRKFARMVGNEDDLVPLANEQYDEDYPEKWDEMSEADQEEWKKAHMMKPNAEGVKPNVQPQPLAPVANAQPVQASVPQEVQEIAALVKEVGGVSALRTLLLSAATVTANAMEQEETERKRLAETIKANSLDLTDADLEEIPLPALRKLAASLQPATALVDFSALGARLNANSLEGKIAPRPSLLLNQAKPN
jgi:hypothetical protein